MAPLLGNFLRENEEEEEEEEKEEEKKRKKKGRKSAFLDPKIQGAYITHLERKSLSDW